MIEIDGWISLHRKLLDNPVVCKDNDHLAVWIYLLLNATHTDYDVVFEGERRTLRPGQLITGRKSISANLKVSESKVQRILKTFEIEQQIEQQTTPRNRLISIRNWKSYQQNEQHFEQQLNNKRTTSEQQLNTNNNIITEQHNKYVYTELEKLWCMPITPLLASSIDDLVIQYGTEKVIDGIKICAENTKYTVNYLKGVVRNGSKRKGVKNGKSSGVDEEAAKLREEGIGF